MVTNSWRQWLIDARELVFPTACACGAQPLSPALGWCAACLASLPLATELPAIASDNSLYLRLRTLLPLGLAVSLFPYEPHSLVQRFLHDLKYYHKPELGQMAGRWLGELLQTTTWSPPDALLPVPIHKEKRKQRGYNQAEVFAQTLGQVWGVPLVSEAATRTIHSEAQARQHREGRYGHLKQAYQIDQPKLVAGRHIAIADDVVTTGATIEALASLLVEAGATRVSVVAIASVY